MGKILAVILLAAMALGGYFAYQTWTSGIQGRIGSLQGAEQLFQTLRRDLESEADCAKVFTKPLGGEGAGKVLVTLKDNSENLLESAYLSAPVPVGQKWQARLKVKMKAQAKEQNLALLQYEVDETRQIISCRAAPVAEEWSGCTGDNSPDPLRPGGKANRVRAPHGTQAVSGPHVQPVFAFAGVLKWLPSGACGPVSVCEHGLWTTVAVIPCATPDPNKNPDSGA